VIKHSLNSDVHMNVQHHNNHKRCAMREHIMTARQTGFDTRHGVSSVPLRIRSDLFEPPV
jgi:hypothetical protein